MVETKRYKETPNNTPKLKDFIFKIKDFGNLNYYQNGQKIDFSSLDEKVKKVIAITFLKPPLMIRLLEKKIEEFENFIQKETGFTQDINSKNFNKEAVYKYFKKFLNQDSEYRKYFNEKLDKIEIEINGKRYSIRKVIFELVFPELVDRYKVISSTKKEIRDLENEVRK